MRESWRTAVRWPLVSWRRATVPPLGARPQSPRAGHVVVLGRPKIR